MKKILTVVGTRPNIIKITQFKKVAAKYPDLDYKLLHTGQHYSSNMNDVFFDELRLDLPDFSLDVDKSSVLKQIAGIMTGMEDVVNEYQPDAMLVVGDVNSTLAAAIVANKSNITLAHVESGLRSYDRRMPEEHNRILTDSISDHYFVTEQSGLENLKEDGHSDDRIHFVGNTMIDTLVAYDHDIRASGIRKELGLEDKEYVLLTMHRPGNVDNKEGLTKLADILDEVGKNLHIVFPIHPRTMKMVEEFGLGSRFKDNPSITLLDPIGYLDFQHLILHSFTVITDSGGIQEETTFRKVPCITLRPNTERPSTLTIGSNTLLEFDVEKILNTLQSIRDGSYKSYDVPPLWDGKSTERIFEVIASKF